MPSQRPSWFARHCAPPPPLNSTSTCPCASCFNLPEARATAQPQEHRRWWASPSKGDADVWSVDSSADSYTTTTHVERVTKH